MRTYRVWTGYEMIYQDIPSDEGVSMRCTGLTDAKNIPIYESDVVTNGRIRGVIEYDESTDKFVIRHGLDARGFYEARDFVVIGNAFENKELI